LFNRSLSERMRLGHAPGVPLVGDMVLTVDKKGLPDQERWIEVNPENVELMARRCREGKAFVSGVLFGWKSLFASGIQGEIEERIVREENLKQDDFMIPAMRRMSSKGTRRALVSPYWEFTSNVVGGVAQFNFALPRGTYATVLLREFMKESLGKLS
jgi:tRNA pseudouridine13 synthase